MRIWAGRLCAAAVVCGWIGLVRQTLALGPPTEGIVWSRYPRGLTEAVLNNGWRGPVMAPYPWSGYILWRLYPQRRVYAYGRLDLFGRRISEMEKARQSPALWQALLDRYGIGIVLEPMPRRAFPGRVFDRRGRLLATVPRSPLAAYMPRDRWALTYWDDGGLLFVRRGPEVREEYRLLEPSDLAYLRLLQGQGRLDTRRLRLELARHRAQTGASRRAAGFAALLDSAPAGRQENGMLKKPARRYGRQP